MERPVAVVSASEQFALLWNAHAAEQIGEARVAADWIPHGFVLVETSAARLMVSRAGRR